MHDHDGVGEEPVRHGDSAPEGTGAAPPGPARAALAGALVAAMASYGWWAVARTPFSSAATVAVLAAGVAAGVAGRRRPPRPSRPVGARRAAPWLAVAAAGAAWQLAAFVQHPREDHPTLSLLANGVLDGRPARAAAFVVWVVAMAALARP